MNDLTHVIFGDLKPGPSGDLAVSGDLDAGRERVLRRLLTNPGDYPFHPDYGAGLARMVGDTADVGRIKAAIRGQMLLEQAVAQQPEPIVDVALIPRGVTCSIRYTDAATGQPAALSFNVTV
ncbi:MAG: phage tail protein [Aquabacterium sp.]